MRAVVFTETRDERRSSSSWTGSRPSRAPGRSACAWSASGSTRRTGSQRKGASTGAALAYPEVVPNQDGSGVIDAIGEGVGSASRSASRYGGPCCRSISAPAGTAQELVVLPRERVAALPDGSQLRCRGEPGRAGGDRASVLPHRRRGRAFQLRPGAFDVHDGARRRTGRGRSGTPRSSWLAVGRRDGDHDSERSRRRPRSRPLPRAPTTWWSTPSPGRGSSRSARSRRMDVHLVVEVAPARNAELNHAVIAIPRATISIYANDGSARAGAMASGEHDAEHPRYPHSSSCLYTSRSGRGPGCSAISDVNRRQRRGGAASRRGGRAAADPVPARAHCASA